MNDLKKRFGDRNLSIFFYLFSISFLYIFPILLANRYYIDDLGRGLYGYSRWKLDGRPLANVLMQILNFGKPLLDLSPITQILSIFVLSISLTFYANKYFKKGSAFSVSVCLFLFVGSPFLIQNLSYKYDSVTMVLSLVSIILCFSIKMDSLFRKFLGSLLVVADLSMYQASLGLFFILCVMEIIYNIYENNFHAKEVFSTLAFRIGQFLLGYLIYVKVILKNSNLDEYSQGHSGTLPFDAKSFYIFITNMKEFLSEIQIAVMSLPKFLIAFYLLVIFLFSFKVVVKSKYNIFASIVSIIAPFLCLIFTFIHVCVLHNPVFGPRVLLSFCGFMLFLSFCVYNSFGKFSVYAFMPLVYFFFFLSYSYSNASAAQNRIDTFVASSIAYDESHYNGQFKTLSIIGTMPEAKQRKLIVKKLPMMDALIPIYMSDASCWGGELLKSFLIKEDQRDADAADFSFIKENKPFVVSQYYSLYAKKEKMIIVFNKANAGESSVKYGGAPKDML